MSTLMDASNQWATRPADQRFTSLTEMHTHALSVRANSSAKVISNRAIEARPIADDRDRKGLVVVGPNGNPVTPTNWSFGQLAQRAGAPAGFLRTLPSDIAADCLNWGLRQREVEEVGVLLSRDVERSNTTALAACTGPNYGRIWNDQIIGQLIRTFGDGPDSAFRVPGEFGKRVEVTKANTTLFASDRDMFVFLADEENRIEIPNRRDGQTGTLARGFFVRNSDVGGASFDIDTFLFDYACSNRIVWGVSEHAKVSFRHSKGAPDRFAEQVAPALLRMHDEKTHSIVQAIADARAHRIGDKDAVSDFLAKRYTKSQASAIMAAHMTDEGRPIETLWDAATGATAYARGLEHQDSRWAVEKEAGKILDLAK